MRFSGTPLPPATRCVASSTDSTLWVVLVIFWRGGFGFRMFGPRVGSEFRVLRVCGRLGQISQDPRLCREGEALQASRSNLILQSGRTNLHARGGKSLTPRNETQLVPRKVEKHRRKPKQERHVAFEKIGNGRVVRYGTDSEIWKNFAATIAAATPLPP